MAVDELKNVHPVRSSIGLAVTAAVAGTPTALAQEGGLEEIIVTATKREVSLQDIPIAVTAFTEEEIVFQRFRNFEDYVGQIPSLSFSDRQPGAKSIIMRGCAAQGLAFADSATTSVYLDEQPITSSGFNPDPRLIDVQRVEALAGPQGTLFGDAAQCGTLRIITNKPDTTAATGWVDLSGFGVTDGGAGFDLSAMANIPLIQDKLALRLVGFYADEPGWIDNILSPTPGQTSDNADQVRDDVNSSIWSGARGMLRFNPNEQWTVDLGAIYQSYELDGFGDADLNQQFFEDTNVFPTFGSREQARFTEDTWEDEWYQIALTIEGDLSFGNVVLTGAYFSRDSEYFADATAYHKSFQERGDYFREYNAALTIYDFGGDPISSDFDARETTVKSLELRYATPAEGRWSAIVGGFYSQREVNEIFISNTFNDFSSTPAFAYINYNGYVYYGVPLSTNSNNWFSGSYDAELEQWAIFGEVGFDITENFSITAGGRYYDIQNDYLNQRGTLIGLNGGRPDCAVNFCYGEAEPGIGSDTGFVPKINFSYRFSDDKMVYATYSEGFRRGGANSGRPQSVFGIPGRFPEPAGTLSEYKADTVQNVELGAKTDWLDGRLRLNGAVYQLTWDDIQVQANDPQDGINGFGIINFPEADIKGVEAWLSWLPTDSLSVEATVGYNEGELSEDAVIFPGTAEEVFAPGGTRLPIVPDWQASLNLTYSIQQTWFGGQPYVFARYNYTGDSINSLAGIESNEFQSPIRTQSAWSTLDLTLGVETETWSAALWIDNVTDEEAELFFNNRFNQQRSSTNRPRSYGVTLRYNFGGN
ncbi:MAG: TonB-dependent receptor [Pseudomonadota bacterium]